MSFEDLHFPPQGEGQRGRFESSDLNIAELSEYLSQRGEFEDMEDAEETLSTLYKMRRYRTEDEIHSDMTRRFKGVTPEDLAKLKSGMKIEVDNGEPLSGVDPEEAAAVSLKVKGQGDYRLRIFKTYNRNGAYRFGYILERAS